MNSHFENNEYLDLEFDKTVILWLYIHLKVIGILNTTKQTICVELKKVVLMVKRRIVWNMLKTRTMSTLLVL